MRPRLLRKLSLLQLAGHICSHLQKHGLKAVLTGGSVVSIYTRNRYESYDLDFITETDERTLRKAMEEIGFRRESGRHYTSPATRYYVEFPSPPLAVGNMPLTSSARIKTRYGILRLLDPTQCVMDRLAAWYHWKDRPSLEQALLVASQKRIRPNKIREWSRAEGKEAGYREFTSLLKTARR